MPPRRKSEPCLKFVLVGDSNCGKTQLAKRFTNNAFLASSCTLGMEFSTRTLSFPRASSIKVNLYEFDTCTLLSHFQRAPTNSTQPQMTDTMGSEKYSSVTKSYFRDACGIFLVFDVTNRSSFEGLIKWMRQIEAVAPPYVFLSIIANKCDVVDPARREFDLSIARQFARGHGADFCETSALTGMGVERAFRRTVVSVYRHFPEYRLHPLCDEGLPEGYIRTKNGGVECVWTGEVLNSNLPLESLSPHPDSQEMGELFVLDDEGATTLAQRNMAIQESPKLTSRSRRQQPGAAGAGTAQPSSSSFSTSSSSSSSSSSDSGDESRASSLLRSTWKCAEDACTIS